MQKELLELCDRHCMGIQGRDICAYFLAESGKLHINYYVLHAQTYLCVFVSHTEIFIKTQKLLLGAHSVIKDQLVVIHAHRNNSYERCSEIFKATKHLANYIMLLWQNCVRRVDSTQGFL